MKIRRSKYLFPLLIPALVVLGGDLRAENGYDAWLRYVPIDDSAVRQSYESLPGAIVALNDSEVVRAARDEVARGVQGMLGKSLRVEKALPGDGAILLGTMDAFKQATPATKFADVPGPEGFRLQAISINGHACLAVVGSDERGVVYGAFALLRKLALHESLTGLDVQETPYAPVRMVDHWDNADGTIERGYAGKSIFWNGGHVTDNLARIGDYARLLASVGLNSCSVNNVNADTRFITAAYLPELARLAAAMRPWGVRLFVSVDFGSPRKIGGLDTFDPLDAHVADFWKQTVDKIYEAIPDFGGVVLKADSEGRLGPSAYGRSHADAANVIARALKPHGGILFYRGFVYDHHMDWRNVKNDRARAAYDNFHDLDGKFDDNVMVQIKYGPIDFQVREPVSPLFGGLEHTSESLELQITQEYTGQQRHVCFLVPMWKQVLDFDLHAGSDGTPVKALVSGRTFHRPLGAFVAVCNVGRDTNWLAHPLAMANLYGFGRLGWNPDLSSRQIADEWTRLTFGHDPRVVDTVVAVQLKSWSTYEKYTGPLGAGGLTDIINVHYGPGIESSERNGWGQWHRGDEHGIGMDRTVATGTGFIGQYRPAVAAQFESLQTCPDELLLFFHHVPYDHVLHSGKTVIQHVYDSHYEGVDEVRDFVRQWKTLAGRLDAQRYDDVLARLEYQAGHAEVWRDAVCQWFLKMSGIPDQHGRAGHYPNRVEAESMKLDGYAVFDVKPWETASGGKAVQCVSSNRQASASFPYAAAGRFDVDVRYFDQNDGASQFKLFVAGKQVDQWLADDHLPASAPNGHTSTRRNVPGVSLHPGDEIRIEATADGHEQACLDYVEFEPATDTQ